MHNIYFPLFFKCIIKAKHAPIAKIKKEIVTEVEILLKSGKPLFDLIIRNIAMNKTSRKLSPQAIPKKIDDLDAVIFKFILFINFCVNVKLEKNRQKNLRNKSL